MVIIKLSQTSIRCTEIIKRKCNLTVSNLIKLTHNKILIIKLIKTTWQSWSESYCCDGSWTIIHRLHVVLPFWYNKELNLNAKVPCKESLIVVEQEIANKRKNEACKAGWIRQKLKGLSRTYDQTWARSSYITNSCHFESRNARAPTAHDDRKMAD